MRGVLVSMILGLGAAAFGHGGLPAAHQVHVRPGASGEIWLETSFGLVVGDGQGPWRWVCEEAIGYGDHAAILVTEDGRLYAGAIEGLFTSDDHGCNWTSAAALAHRTVSDVHAVPSEPGTVWATTQRESFENALFRSTDGGEFEPTALASTTRYFTAVRAAPSDPSRIYVSAWWWTPTATVYLYRSDDGGESFTEMDLTAELQVLGAFRIWAVDPHDPDVLFASVKTAVPQRSLLLKSTDGGDTFIPVIDTVLDFEAVAITPDGVVVHAATQTEVFRSEDGGDTFSPMGPPPSNNACAAWSDGGWIFCGSQLADGFALARAVDGGTALTPILELEEIEGPISCPAGSDVDQRCVPLWPDVRDSFPGAAPDAGPPPDGGSTGGQDAGTTPGRNGCGCGFGGSAAGAWVVAVGWLALIGRRRSNRIVR